MKIGLELAATAERLARILGSFEPLALTSAQSITQHRSTLELPITSSYYQNSPIGAGSTLTYPTIPPNREDAQEAPICSGTGYLPTYG